MSQGEIKSIRLQQLAMRSFCVMALVVAVFVGGSASANTFFDYTHDPVANPSAPLNGGFTPAPFLTDGNAAAVNTYLSGKPVKALKVYAPVSSGTISTIYGSNVVNYTFADFEGASALANITTLRSQIAGAYGGALPSNVWVGNYDLYPISGDPTRGPGYTPFGYTNFVNSKVNVASESLYPGSWMFRTKTLDQNSQSSAPSIRAALFTLPITRMSLVQATLPGGTKHIPYVTRFNNWGNNLLNDSGNSQFPYKWSNQNPDGTSMNQMISRGDFKAMIAHYRLRGADGVHLLDGGVVNYSQSDFQQDAYDGWHIPQIDAVFAGGGAKLAALDVTARVNGVTQSLENAGLVFSGVYSLTQDAGKGKLVLLVSNMVDADRVLKLPTLIGGKSFANSITVPAGHSLLEFTGAGTQWQLTTPTPLKLFTSDVETDRSGVGVPEPTMMGGVALLALFGLARRRRN